MTYFKSVKLPNGIIHRTTPCEMNCGRQIIWPYWVSDEDILSGNHEPPTCWWCVTPLEKIETTPDIVKQFASGIPLQEV